MLWLQVDLQFFAGEKTEKATPKKRQDSRKKGQVAKSQDINTAVSLLALFMLLLAVGPYMLDLIYGLIRESFQNYMHQDLTEGMIPRLLIEVLQQMGLILAPVFIIAVVIGV